MLGAAAIAVPSTGIALGATRPHATQTASVSVVFTPASPVSAGTNVTITAQVTGSGPKPSGTVEYQVNGTTIAGCAAIKLSPSRSPKATCATTSLPLGNDTIVVLYSGDKNYVSAISPDEPYVVKAAVATVHLAANPASGDVVGGSVTLTANVTSSGATPTGTVEFQSNGVDIGSCSSVALTTGTATCTTSVLAGGTDQLAAVYSGDSNYPAATGNLSYAVAKATTTTGLVANPASGDPAGGSVTLTATVSTGSGTPTGSVEFQSNGTDIPACGTISLDAGAVATCTTTALATGTDALAAIYSGDANYQGSTGNLSYTVGRATPTVYVSVDPSSTVSSVTVRSVVTGAAGIPTGTVEFQSNGTDLTGCSAVALDPTGAATCTVASVGSGPVTLTAIYGGDTIYLGANGSLSFNIGLPIPTVTIGASPSSGDVAGGSVILTATLTSSPNTPTGTVDFQSNGADIAGCSVSTIDSNGNATCTTSRLATGTDSIAVVYGGDSNNNGNGAVLAYVVNKVTPTFTVVPTPASGDTAGALVSFLATVSGSAGAATGTVALRSNGVTIVGCGALAISSGGTATCATKALATGTDAISSTYSGDVNYATANRALSYVVHKAAPTLKFTLSPKKSTTEGTFVAMTVAVSGPSARPTGTVAFRVDGKNISGCAKSVVRSSVATCRTESLVLGAHTLSVLYSGDTNYQSKSTGGGTLTVIPAGYWLSGTNGSTRTYGPTGAGGGSTVAKKIVAVVATPDAAGYWLIGANGSVASRGAAKRFTTKLLSTTASPIVAAASTTTGSGLWLVSANGTVHLVGAAKTFVKKASADTSPTVGIAATPDGKGYWIAHSTGSVARYGDAESLGFTSGHHLNGAIDGIVSSALSKQGYGLVAKDGGVFGFGSFQFFGSLGAKAIPSPIVGMAVSPLGDGYILVARSGTVYPFGHAKKQPVGTGTLNLPVVGIAFSD